jgi:prophage maintenance system killer protein
MMALAMLPPPMKAMDSEGVAGDIKEVIKIAASGVAQNGKNKGRTTEGTHHSAIKRSRAGPQALGFWKIFAKAC